MGLRITPVSFTVSPVRACVKMGCPQPAVATAALRYGERVLWIGDLLPSPDPNLFDLCEPHVTTITPLYGWRKVDGRSPMPAAPMGV
jgi:Protein of unknown function (DUF3499)